MNKKLLESLINIVKKDNELSWIEIKESLADPKKIGETFSAVANSASYEEQDFGYLIWGIENNTWKIKGTNFSLKDLKPENQTGEIWLNEKLNKQCHWDEYEFYLESKRIYVVRIKNCGNVPVSFEKIPYIRKGSHNQLLNSYPEIYKAILLKKQNYDFSAKFCEKAIFDDLDLSALEILRKKWAEKENKDEYLNFSFEEVLEKLFLKRGNKITYSAILLCGKREKLFEYIPEAEIRFGWKNDFNKLDFDFTKDWRAPFLLVIDEIWNLIEIRNTRIPFDEGFFERDIWAFDKKSIREAILNAFAHRDYEERGSIFIEINPDNFIIKSPGNFLPGISPENILDSQGKWRNRFLMETLGKIGLVERYGHGLDRIFSKSISDGKGKPYIKELSTGSVELIIPTQVKDKEFVVFLDKISKEKQINFDLVKDLIFLEEIREKQFSLNNKKINKFLEIGILEKMGSGRGTKYIFSKNFYNFIGKNSEYTRKKWLAKEQQKIALLNFLKQHKKGRMEHFRDGLFEGKLNNLQINTLLNELRNEKKVYFDGPQKSRSAFWKLCIINNIKIIQK